MNLHWRIKLTLLSLIPALDGRFNGVDSSPVLCYRVFANRACVTRSLFESVDLFPFYSVMLHFPDMVSGVYDTILSFVFSCSFQLIGLSFVFAYAGNPHPLYLSSPSSSCSPSSPLASSTRPPGCCLHASRLSHIVG